MEISADIVVVGTGVGGLFSTLWLPEEKQVVLITKSDLESSDSFLAQGGICVLRDEKDYESFFEDTMKAGHYENRKESVDLMIRKSREIIDDLIGFGVDFEQEDGCLKYTREGAHSCPRILFHKDITGKEITSKLLERVKERKNVTIFEHTTMTDLIEDINHTCVGILAKRADGEELEIYAENTVFATGGIGGQYKHSTNFPILTGDGCEIARKHSVELEHMDYVQIHPTCFYTENPGRSFLISESARGEGAIILNHKKERFVDELQPRDVVTKAIQAEMEKEGVKYEFLSFENVPRETILNHFPHIYEHCMKYGFDILMMPIPIVPAQHYFMGGIHVDKFSHTTMPHLYAVGETSCNGVHGKNRLASNSLLESLVFAKRAAKHMIGELV